MKSKTLNYMETCETYNPCQRPALKLPVTKEHRDGSDGSVEARAGQKVPVQLRRSLGRRPQLTSLAA